MGAHPLINGFFAPLQRETTRSCRPLRPKQPRLSLERGSQRSCGKRALPQRECRPAERLCRLGPLPCALLREGWAKGASIRQERSLVFHSRSPPDSHHSVEIRQIPAGFPRGSPSLSAHYAIEHGLSALRAALELEVRVCCRHDWRAGEQGSEKDGALQSEQVYGLISSCGRGRWMRNPTGLPLWHSTEFGAQRTGRGWVDPHGPVSQP
jgi:hypothetical protein